MSTTHWECSGASPDRLVAAILQLRQAPEEEDEDEEEEDRDEEDDDDDDDSEQDDDSGYSE